MGFLFPRHEKQFSRMRWVATLQGGRESPCLLASSKERTKTDPPEKGHHMSPRAQKCFQPPSITSTCQDCPNPAEPCQVPHSLHLLLWATTSAQGRTSLVLRLCWTWRDLSPGHAVLLLFLRESEASAAGPTAGRDFASSHAGLDIGTIHPSTRHKLDLPKAHMSEMGRSVQPAHHGNCYHLPPRH